MDTFEVYCNICGCPFSLTAEEAVNPKFKWLQQVRIEGHPINVTYDLRGNFVDKNIGIVANINDGILPVHYECYKLNGYQIPKTKLKTPLDKYHKRFFDFEEIKDLSLLEDPRSKSTF